MATAAAPEFIYTPHRNRDSMLEYLSERGVEDPSRLEAAGPSRELGPLNPEQLQAFVDDPELLRDHIDQRGLELVRFKQYERAVLARHGLAETLAADPDVNGNAYALTDNLVENYHQIKTKESWLGRIAKVPGKVLGYAWDTVKAHPILSTAAVVGLLYFTGWGSAAGTAVQSWASRLPDGGFKTGIDTILNWGKAAPALGEGASPGINVPPTVST